MVFALSPLNYHFQDIQKKKKEINYHFQDSKKKQIAILQSSAISVL